MHEQCYAFGPLMLRVQCANGLVQQRLAAHWAQLFRLPPTPIPTAESGATLTVNLAATPTAPPALLANQPGVVYFGPAMIWPTSTGFDLGLGQSRLAVTHGAAAGYLADDFWAQALVVQRDFWQRLFFLLSRTVDCHLLHANALIPPTPGPAGGLLLVGDCGAGKTTLTMSLIAAGWHYLSDDNVLLQPTAAGVMAHAVRRGFACTVETAAQWALAGPGLDDRGGVESLEDAGRSRSALPPALSIHLSALPDPLSADCAGRPEHVDPADGYAIVHPPGRAAAQLATRRADRAADLADPLSDAGHPVSRLPI